MPAKPVAQGSYKPRYLGKRAPQPVSAVDLIPWQGAETVITLDCDEFSSLCPVTGQPDYATLTISYEPLQHLVESKSLKLYLWQFRELGIFNEVLVERIAADLFRQLQPKWLEVEGHFHSRGGIRISARSRRPVLA